MKQFLAFFLVFFLFVLNPAFSQKKVSENMRGTIRVKKVIPNKYVISKATNLKTPKERTFRVRFYNYGFKEYFPKEYKSDLFPLMLNRVGLYMATEKEQYTDNQIVSYEYEIFKNQVSCLKGVIYLTNINYPIRLLSKMMNGSCIWIKNLAYKDKNGVIHRNKIGEFKIEKVK